MNFPRFENHVCLVSDQNAPNYLGAILPDAAPRRVHLIVTEQMKDRAKLLEKQLRTRIQCEIQYYMLPSIDLNLMTQKLDDILAACAGESLAFNLTGGTKTMALAAVAWADIQDHRPFLFYVDTNAKKILQLGGKVEEYPLNIEMKLDEIFFLGTGASIGKSDAQSVNSADRDLLDALMQLFSREPKTLELFNKCAVKAQDSLSAPMPVSPPRVFLEVLDLLHEAGKIKRNDEIISYPSEETRFWCNGGWLEDYVRTRIFKMKADGLIHDWGSNVELVMDRGANTRRKSWFSRNARNELDAVFTADNQLYVIECKSANLEKKDYGFSNAIYKLDSLSRNLGGVMSHAMIVSVHELKEDQNVERCNDLGIKLVHGQDVLRLDEKLRNWVTR